MAKMKYVTKATMLEENEALRALEQDSNLDWLSESVNRSKGQELFLFNLVGGDFEVLKELEVKIKNCFISYCPSTTEQVTEIMNMPQKSNWFILPNMSI